MQTESSYIPRSREGKAPRISFILTTFNLPTEYLRECLGSILALPLTREEREIILLDDGSDVSPMEELKEFEDDLTYVRQTNQGPSMARNNALERASGEYIQFVDGDDHLLPDTYAHCLHLVRELHPDLVYFRFRLTERTAREASYTDTEPVSGCEYLLHNNLRVMPWSYVFRRELLGSLRFTPGILHEDEEFTPLLFLKAKRLVATDAQAYFYRTRNDSIMHQRADSRHNRKRLGDTERVIGLLQERTAGLEEREREALERRIAQLTMDYLYNTIRLTGSLRELEETLGRLQGKGLFPLPKRRYTWKYRMFCRVIGCKGMRRLMVVMLSRMKG